MEKIYKVLDIAQAQQIRENDTVFCIVGPEGSSKSNLGLWAMDYLGAKINRIALDREDFLDVLSNSYDLDLLDFDEAGDGLFSRDFASKFNKELVKAFMIIRAKRLIVFLTLPSFFMIDVYFRRHRIKGLFYVYKRGKCAFFDKRGINQIIERGERFGTISGVKPLFYDNFPKYEGRLLKDYLEKKNTKVADTLKDLVRNEKKEK